MCGAVEVVWVWVVVGEGVRVGRCEGVRVAFAWGWRFLPPAVL